MPLDPPHFLSFPGILTFKRVLNSSTSGGLGSDLPSALTFPVWQQDPAPGPPAQPPLAPCPSCLCNLGSSRRKIRSGILPPALDFPAPSGHTENKIHALDRACWPCPAL